LRPSAFRPLYMVKPTAQIERQTSYFIGAVFRQFFSRSFLPIRHGTCSDTKTTKITPHRVPRKVATCMVQRVDCGQRQFGCRLQPMRYICRAVKGGVTSAPTRSRELDRALPTTTALIQGQALLLATHLRPSGLTTRTMKTSRCELDMNGTTQRE